MDYSACPHLTRATLASLQPHGYAKSIPTSGSLCFFLFPVPPDSYMNDSLTNFKSFLRCHTHSLGFPDLYISFFRLPLHHTTNWAAENNKYLFSHCSGGQKFQSQSITFPLKLLVEFLFASSFW